MIMHEDQDPAKHAVPVLMDLEDGASLALLALV